MRTMLLLIALCLCSAGYAAQEPGDVLTVKTTAAGVCTATIVFDARDILEDGGNRCEVFKALCKRAFEQSKIAAIKRLAEIEAEAEAAEKAAEKNKRSEATIRNFRTVENSVVKDSLTTDRVWQMWELPGHWRCAGKECSRADVVEIPENAR